MPRWPCGKTSAAATSFRVVNAESDFLSGLIVDKYEDVLVLQISSLGMDQRKPMIVAALQKSFRRAPFWNAATGVPEV